MQRTSCPHCGKRLKYEGGMEGGAYKCPKCGKVVTLRLPSDVAKELQQAFARLKRVLPRLAIVLVVAVPIALFAYFHFREPPAHTGTITLVTPGPTTFINMNHDKSKTVWVLAVAPQTIVLDGTAGTPVPTLPTTLQVGQSLKVWLVGRESTIKKLVITGKGEKKG